jgi:hypothetical protein
MSEQASTGATEDFDAELAAVERFISEVQQGSVPTGEAMRAYRDVHRLAIERLRTQLAEFEDLLGATAAGGALGEGTGQASGDGTATDEASTGSA